MNAIESCIAELDGKIADLQSLRTNLVNAMPLLYPTGVAPKTASPAPDAKPEKRKYKKRTGPAIRVGKMEAGAKPNGALGQTRPTSGPPPDAALGAFDKPKTIGGAMKAAICKQTRFTGEALRSLLLQDTDIRKLLEEATPGAVAGNLTYWAERGYLTRDGEKPLDATYTVTAAGKEWFSK